MSLIPILSIFAPHDFLSLLSHQQRVAWAGHHNTRDNERRILPRTRAISAFSEHAGSNAAAETLSLQGAALPLMLCIRVSGDGSGI